MSKSSIFVRRLVPFAVALFWATAALADKVDDLIAKLKDPDNKVRLSAAVNLGKLGDKRAVRPLTDALKDSDKTVRGIAATGLGKLLDSTVPAADCQRAVAALDSMRQNDPDSFAKGQAEKAWNAVKGVCAAAAPGGGGGGGGGGGIGGKTVYVEIGPFADTSKNPDPKALPAVRKAIESELGKSFATRWPGGKSPTKQDLANAGVKAFYVDGTIVAVDVKTAGTTTTITCKTSVLVATYPDKSIFGMLDANKNKATVEVGTSKAEIDEGKLACVEYLAADMAKKQVVPLIKTK